MTKVTPPMRITFQYDGKDFNHGHVVARTNDVIQFHFRDAPNATPTLLADASDEGATWVKGWLRWWWPPDWKTKKAMLAAAAMGNAGVRLSETAEAKQARHAADLWKKTWAARSGDMDKVMGDLQRTLTRRR